MPLNIDSTPTRPKFYIATRLENHQAHNNLRDALVDQGFEITYDWTTHGPVWTKGLDRIREVAELERVGVYAADVVIVLMPGGRGTHAELGMAIAYNKPVVIVSDNLDHFVASPETCAFYHNPCVSHLGAMVTRAEMIMHISHRVQEAWGQYQEYEPEEHVIE